MHTCVSFPVCESTRYLMQEREHLEMLWRWTRPSSHSSEFPPCSSDVSEISKPNIWLSWDKQLEMFTRHSLPLIMQSRIPETWSIISFCLYNNPFLNDFPFLTQTLRSNVCGNHFILSPYLLHSLEDNDIHDDGALALAKGLYRNTTLVELK